MKHWCPVCKKYTEHSTIKYHESGSRDMGDGSLADRRTIKCDSCGNKGTYDFAPDRR